VIGAVPVRMPFVVPNAVNFTSERLFTLTFKLDVPALIPETEFTLTLNVNEEEAAITRPFMSDPRFQTIGQFPLRQSVTVFVPTDPIFGS
jgi:hypothetical protein